MPSLRPTTVLLTLDAFNTLFYPRQHVALQYAQIAQSFGFLSSSASSTEIQTAFRTAYKRESALHPNYGRNIPGFGGPKEWWGNVIRGCFAQAKNVEVSGRSNSPANGQNLVAPKDVPNSLVEKVIEQFEGRQGYALYNDVEDFFRTLRTWKQNGMQSNIIGHRIGPDRNPHETEVIERIVVGIISNADDRITSILRSFGFKIGPGNTDTPMGQLQDLDFVLTSYEAGKEKPHRHIFDLALARAKAQVRDNTHWRYLHIGDDYEQDYLGAMGAGWDGFLVLRESMDYLPGTLNSSRPEGEEIKVLRTLTEVFPLLGWE
ncbi:hypothetical protein FQN57_001529 [Myotisia sp. PD_48]|nr:hypothetical protein FQN57_001529 [Myotisia sp. PD_48]